MFSLFFFLPENDAEKCFALLPFLPARVGMATTPQNDSIICTERISGAGTGGKGRYLLNRDVKNVSIVREEKEGRGVAFAHVYFLIGKHYLCRDMISNTIHMHYGYHVTKPCLYCVHVVPISLSKSHKQIMCSRS